MTTPIPPSSPPDPELLDEPTAGRLCGMSGRSLRRLAERGEAPQSRNLGRLVRWSRRELLDWIAAGCPTMEGRV